MILEEVLIAEGNDQVVRGYQEISVSCLTPQLWKQLTKFDALRTILSNGLMCHKFWGKRGFTEEVPWRMGSPLLSRAGRHNIYTDGAGTVLATSFIPF